MQESDDVRDHITQFLDTVTKLQAIEIDAHGDLLAIMLFHNLPDSYDNFRCAIKSRDALPDIDTLATKIIEESAFCKPKGINAVHCSPVTREAENLKARET